MHSPWLWSTFHWVWKFLETKEGGSNFSGEPILRKDCIIWSPLLIFNFKRFMGPNSSPFIRFQCILHDSGLLFAESWSFYKLKSGDIISGGNQFGRTSELLVPPYCVSILKVVWIQIHRHLLDFNGFFMIQEFFLQSLEISRN